MITVIIVNWNSGDHLERCLKYLSEQDLPPSRVLVIDNGSSDGSADIIEEKFDFELQRLGYNYGFAGGNNRALKQVDTEFVALLNPDAFPKKNWLKSLIVAAQEYPDVAAFGSLQVMLDNDELVDGMGDVCHLSGLVWRSGYGRPLNLMSNTPFEIFSPCAGAALYRTDALIVVGGFDEDFFCYVEDVDLGFRLRLAGFKSMLVPDAIVHHVGAAASGGRDSDFSIYHGHRNLVWSYVKNMPGVLFWLCLPLHFVLNIAEIFWFTIRRKGSVILRAKRDAVFGLRKMRNKRKQIQKQRSVSVYDIWQVLDKRFWPSRR
jgi:GT2 family glycosyltransferase